MANKSIFLAGAAAMGALAAYALARNKDDASKIGEDALKTAEDDGNENVGDASEAPKQVLEDCKDEVKKIGEGALETAKDKVEKMRRNDISKSLIQALEDRKEETKEIGDAALETDMVKFEDGNQAVGDVSEVSKNALDDGNHGARMGKSTLMLGEAAVESAKDKIEGEKNEVDDLSHKHGDEEVKKVDDALEIGKEKKED